MDAVGQCALHPERGAHATCEKWASFACPCRMVSTPWGPHDCVACADADRRDPPIAWKSRGGLFATINAMGREAQVFFGSPIGILSILLLAACGSDKSSTPVLPPGAPAATASCEERVRRFESRTTGIDNTSLSTPLPGIEAPRGRGGMLPRVAPIVSLFFDGQTNLDGRFVALPQLVADLATLERNWQVLHPELPPGSTDLVLWADRRLRMGDLRPLIAATPGYSRELVWMDTTMRPPLPHCPPSLGGRCIPLGGGPQRREAALIDAMAASTDRCPAFRRMRQAVAHTGMVLADKEDVWRTAGAQALRECDCRDVDVDGFEYITLVAFGAFNPQERGTLLPDELLDVAELTVQQWVDRQTTP